MMDNKNKHLALKNFMDDFWDMILLNIMFVLSCLPVLTCGAAVGALHHSITNLGKKRGLGGVTAMYWQSFKAALKPCIGLCAILLLTLALMIFDFQLAGSIESRLRYCMFGLLGFASLALQTVASAAFPLLVSGYGTALQSVRAALTMLAAYPLRMFAVCVLQSAPLLMALLFPRIFAALFILWIAVYFSLSELAISALLAAPLAQTAREEIT